MLADAGVKYFSIGPNGGHRIGYTLQQWGDKAVLLGHALGQAEGALLDPAARGYYPRLHHARAGRSTWSLPERRATGDYPYDMIQVALLPGRQRRARAAS